MNFNIRRKLLLDATDKVISIRGILINDKTCKLDFLRKFCGSVSLVCFTVIVKPINSRIYVDCPTSLVSAWSLPEYVEGVIDIDKKGLIEVG